MTQPYQLIANSDTVFRRSDSAYIPGDPANRDRSEYEQWLLEGNIPDPPDTVPEPESPPILPDDPTETISPETELKIRFVDDRTGQAKDCRHDAYKGMAVHGRCCPDCGTFMVDFGN